MINKRAKMEFNWEVSWSSVLFISTITAIATGLGAVPFVFKRSIKKKILGYANAMAAGLMFAASCRLVNEGTSESLWKTVVGFIIGLVLIHVINKRLSENKKFEIGNLQGVNALKALMIVGVMTIHSFAEGIGVGVSFSGGQEFGIFVATAIAVHNIPEGLAISIVLIPREVKTWKAIFWAIFSSIPQPLLAVPAFLFVEKFRTYLPVGLGIAGGAMVWMVTAELLPDALEDAKKENVSLVMAFAVILMILFQTVIEV